MPVNLNKPELWKKDITQSVDFYNEWFIRFAPLTFRQAREEAAKRVEQSIIDTDYLSRLVPDMLKDSPDALLMMRQATAPPLARDRLAGLASVSSGMVKRMEEGHLPSRMSEKRLDASLGRICDVISQLLDRDIFPWLETNTYPSEIGLERAATVVADRLTGATADPIIRNAQEQRQLAAIKDYLEAKGYKAVRPASNATLQQMEPGTYTFRFNVVVGEDHKVNIPIDVVIQPHQLRGNQLPLLVEAKSAGDFTNTNKRRKEEATKMRQLRDTYGDEVEFILFLNGYFDSGYLGYEAAEGIDWVWEHRAKDLDKFDL